MPPRPPEACRYQPEEYAVTNMPDQVGRDVVVIGGCGHVGLPLALAFADRGARVGIYDVSEAAVATDNSGQQSNGRSEQPHGQVAENDDNGSRWRFRPLGTLISQAPA